jgi:hypothetical protein
MLQFSSKFKNLIYLKISYCLAEDEFRKVYNYHNYMALQCGR